MGYVTIRNIESETSYSEKDWSLFVLKELEDNSFDWLNDYYPAKKIEDKNKRKIEVILWITAADQTKLIHIAVRNSNLNNIPVFEDLNKTFDFYAWHSTKRNQHRMTTGSLGDALKRCLGMGYASWTSNYDCDSAFEEIQWNEPVILRYNKREFRVYIKVDTSSQRIWIEIQVQKEPSRIIGFDTEVEVTLPLSESLEDAVHCINRLTQYYNIYKLGKSSIDFSLSLDKTGMEQ